MILLDTCTVLWLCADQRKLSARARKEIEKHPESLFVSSISAFEIGLKNRRGRITLPLPAQRWFDLALESHGIREIEVSARIAILATELPELHADPCDRIIVATAALHELVCLTPDPMIRQYPRVSVAW